MVHKLIEFSIKYRAFVVIGFAVLALGSVFAVKNARIDAIPDIGAGR